MKRRVVAPRFCATLVLVLLAAGSVSAVDLTTVRPQRDNLPAPPRRAQLASLRPAGAPTAPFAPTSVPSLDGSPVDYLVVTSSALAPAFERLAAWKTARGVPAVVRTVDEIAASGVQGSDLAETVRSYIRDAYLYWGVRFVLLGGDTEILAPRYADNEFLGLTDPVTDLYFSCLDGDWNADADGAFGEPYLTAEDPGDDADLVSEVFVGRAPASTLAEANVFVDKTIAYERGDGGDFSNAMLLMAEVLFPVDWSPGNPVGIDGATFAERLRLELVPPWMDVRRLYQNDLIAGAGLLTVENSIAAIDSGYGIVVHIGHGFRYTLSVGNGSLDVGDAAAFANGPRSGLFYMLNCTAAAYDFESFAEALLLNPTGGATLVVGAAREAFPLAASDYQYAFFQHVFLLGQRRIGEAMARSREEFADPAYYNGVDRWTQLTYTLLGDPETSLRIRSPLPLTVDVPAAIAVGSQSAAFTVTDTGGPVRGAVVCVRKDGEVYRVASTDASGQATLLVEPRTPGTLEVTVWSADHVLETLELDVTSPSRALVVADPGVTDDGAGSGSGNSDGRLDAGETATMSLLLRNAGSLAVTGLAATLESADPDVQVVQAASSYPTIGAGSEVAASTPFAIQVPVGVADQRRVSLVLHLTHDAGQESRAVELQVHAARPGLVELRLDDARAGNGNGVQDPGEEIDLFYTVENRGTGALQDGALELSALGPGIEVLSSDIALPEIAPGQSLESPQPLVVREMDVSSPHPARLTLRHLQDPSGSARRIDLRPPAAPSIPSFVPADAADEVQLEWTAPADADLLGYVVFRAALPGGSFARVNPDFVSPTAYLDAGLQSSARYAYRVAAVDSTLLVGPAGPDSAVSTNPQLVAGWPITANDRSSSTLGVGDVDANGILDVVVGARQIYAWDAHGVELLDADQNPVTWGMYYGTSETFGSITLADLDPNPGKEIVAVTWDPIARYAVVLGPDGAPLPGWPRPLVVVPDPYRGSLVPPVVVNLDDAGAPEILVTARDGRLYAWHADGTEVTDGDANPATSGVFMNTGAPFLASAPGVADLDPARPGVEVVLGGSTGLLHIVDATGQPLPGWPRSTDGGGVSFGGGFASGISIADLDADGRLEIVVLDFSGRMHALHLDATELAGFPVSGILAHSQSVVPSPAIGDLAGDSRLEVAIAGSDGKLFVFDATGASLLPGGSLDSGAPTESSPILGDVDGDDGIEIVLGNEAGVLQAWNLDGTLVAGFPILLRAEVRGVPQLGDFDANGTADLAVVAWDGLVRMWDLGVPWRPDRAPWPMHRGNAHRTGELGYEVPTPVVVSDLGAAVMPQGSVRLSWRADSSSEPVLWRVYRAGPFASRPLGMGRELAYNGKNIGESEGTGSLEFVDANVAPGAWYAYVLGMVEQPDEAGAVEVLYGPLVVETAAPPAALRIAGNVPNPFNPTTTLQLEVPFQQGGGPLGVELVVFDAQGRPVRRLWRGDLSAGHHAVTWDGRDDDGHPVASGVYIARATASGLRATSKLTLVR